MRTKLCDELGIDVPIFAFSHCRDVVAAVTNAGGMGVLGALAFSPEQLDIELKWIDEHVGGKPYGVDIVMPMSYAGKDEGLGKADESTGKVDPAVFKNLIPEEVTEWIEGVLDEYDVPPLPPDYHANDGVGGAAALDCWDGLTVVRATSWTLRFGIPSSCWSTPWGRPPRTSSIGRIRTASRWRRSRARSSMR
jgi:hypothetical protein